MIVDLETDPDHMILIVDSPPVSYWNKVKNALLNKEISVMVRLDKEKARNFSSMIDMWVDDEIEMSEVDDT